MNRSGAEKVKFHHRFARKDRSVLYCSLLAGMSDVLFDTGNPGVKEELAKVAGILITYPSSPSTRPRDFEAAAIVNDTESQSCFWCNSPHGNHCFPKAKSEEYSHAPNRKAVQS